MSEFRNPALVLYFSKSLVAHIFTAVFQCTVQCKSILLKIKNYSAEQWVKYISIKLISIKIKTNNIKPVKHCLLLAYMHLL